MTIEVKSLEGGRVRHIRLGKRLDFEQNRAFRDAYRTVEASGTLFRVDFSQTDYIDSAGIGMLLILKEYAQSKHSSVVLCGMRADVRKTIEVANLQQLFTVEA